MVWPRCTASPAAQNSKRRNDVGFREIVAFEQERLACGSGERVGEAVAGVQTCLVLSLTEIAKGLPCDENLFHGDRLDNDSCAREKHIYLVSHARGSLALNDYKRFEKISGTDAAVVCIVNCLFVLASVRLKEKNRDQSRCVDNHLGRPLSSYISAAIQVSRCTVRLSSIAHCGTIKRHLPTADPAR